MAALPLFFWHLGLLVTSVLSEVQSQGGRRGHVTSHGGCNVLTTAPDTLLQSLLCVILSLALV